MVKKPVIFKSLVKEASEEVESVIQKVTAVEVQAEIISSDTGTCRRCLSQMFGLNCMNSMLCFFSVSLSIAVFTRLDTTPASSLLV